MVTVEIIERDSELQALRPVWTDILRRSERPNPFLTWEWCEAWWRHYRDGRKLWVLLCRAGREPVAVLPLFRKTGGLFTLVKTVKFLGSEGLCSDYMDMIVARGYEAATYHAIAAFLEKQMASWDVLALDGMPADSRFAAFLRSWSEHAEVVAGGEARVCPFVRLPETWEGFLKSVSRHRRHEIRRTARRLRERGRVSLTRVEDPDDLASAMSDMVRLHERRWASRGLTGNFGSPRYVAFHLEVCRRFLANRMLRLTFLELDGRRVAFRYQFRYGDTMYDYQTGFEELPGVGVGSALIAMVIEKEIQEGVKVHDFLRGDESYKYRWGVSGVHELADLTVVREGLGKVRYEVGRGVRAVSKEVARRYLPENLQTVARRWRR